MPKYRIELDTEQFNAVLHCLAMQEKRYKETAELPHGITSDVKSLMIAAAARCYMTATHIIDKMEAI